MDANRMKIIEKVKKLLALSGSSNEHEAALAAEKAQAILAEYNLSLQDVEIEDRSGEAFTVNRDLHTNSVPWRRQLAAMVAELYFCTYFYAFVKEHNPARKNGYVRYDRHSFAGAEHNIVVARMMFQYLNDTIERLARDASYGHPGSRSAFENSFKHGCATRLCIRIRQRIDAAKAGAVKTEAGTNLPALLDLYESTQQKLRDFLSENVGKLRTSKSRGKATDAFGYAAGKEAGDKISLDRQVGGAAGVKALR